MAELAAEADFSEARINLLVELAEDPVSLNAHVGESDSLSGEVIEDRNGEAPHEATELSLQRRDLGQALQSLEPRPRHVLELRFGLAGSEPKMLAEIEDGSASHASGFARSRRAHCESCGSSPPASRSISPLTDAY